MADYLALAKEAYESSTTFVDANYRADWDYSLRAFRNEHAPGSKYLSDEYKARSHLFPPHTRTVIRKNEAAAAVALFSNMEIVDVQPGNPNDVMSVASSHALKAIIEYRLSRTIPAFPLVMGAVQDAQTTGTVCSYQYWEYQTKADGAKVKDRPCIELRPIENIRLDGGANWIDPVNTTPYFCDIVPMYVCDVRAMMRNKDEKTGAPKWKTHEDSVILRARPDVMDTTRKARLGGQQDPHEETTGIKDFDIVWVMRWFMHDSQGEDQTYYTLGTEELLTDAAPIGDVYFHGKRPYVIGCAIIETHKALKSGLPVLTRPLQQESAEITNQRMDNVRFVLNKRMYVARGRQVDIPALVRNAPGAAILMSDPKNDVVESSWPDVTSSAYVEHDRIKSAFDDLVGNFSPGTRVANNAVNDTLGGSKMANQSAGIMTDYLLRTIVETWWEPVLRQLVLLEQYYETDDVVLAVCADKAQLFPRFGISRITDMMLMNEVNVSVNVGWGASNPNERFQKFMIATKAATQIVAIAPPGFNVPEAIKEIYSNAGYRDGARFFSEQPDPRLLQMMQQIQQMQQALEGKQMEMQMNAQVEQMKAQSNERIKAAQLQVDQGRIQGDLAIRQAELMVEQQKLELEKLKLQVELQMAGDEHSMKATELGVGLQEAQLKLEGERQKLIGQAAKIEAEIEKAQLALQTARDEHNNEGKITEVANDVIGHMQSVSGEMSAMKTAMESTHQNMSGMGMQVDDLRKGLGAMAGMMMQPKKKPKGFALKKPDGKRTSAVVVEYDDGSTDEIVVS